MMSTIWILPSSGCFNVYLQSIEELEEITVTLKINGWMNRCVFCKISSSKISTTDTSDTKLHREAQNKYHDYKMFTFCEKIECEKVSELFLPWLLLAHHVSVRIIQIFYRQDFVTCVLYNLIFAITTSDFCIFIFPEVDLWSSCSFWNWSQIPIEISKQFGRCLFLTYDMIMLLDTYVTG